MCIKIIWFVFKKKVEAIRGKGLIMSLVYSMCPFVTPNALNLVIEKLFVNLFNVVLRVIHTKTIYSNLIGTF